MRKLSSTGSKSQTAHKPLIQHIHVTTWLPHYTKMDLLTDFIAGLTVGMMMIPQAIAYAGLASLPAQYGLYTAFVGSFTYVVFGTIKQVSIGPTSLMSMLTFTYLEGYPVDYVILLTFISGCVELVMGLFKLGFIVDFISPAVSSGFSSAVSVKIILSQLKHFFGLDINAHTSLEVIKMVLEKMKTIKLADTTVGICSMIFLVLIKELARINIKNRISRKIFWLVSISRNALIVLITSAIAFFYCKCYGAAPFELSGNVPSGLPNIIVPHFMIMENNRTTTFFDVMKTFNTAIIVLPICAILSNIAIAKSFASDVVVDASQEMISLGLCNIFGSFVQAMPSSGAFSRSAVSNASGVRTPFQGIFSGMVIILALNFLTPYFLYIPRATLAAVLISAVLTLIEYKIFPVLWRTSRIDFCLCSLTFLLGVIYGANIGIIIGASLNLLVLLKEWSRPKVSVTLEKNNKTYATYVMVKPQFGLLYPAKDFLLDLIVRTHNQHSDLPIILDCSGIFRIDYTIAKTLKKLMETLNNSTTFILINANKEVLKVLNSLERKESKKYCLNNTELGIQMNDQEEDLITSKNED